MDTRVLKFFPFALPRSCLRWLAGGIPNLAEACGAVTRIIREGNRADQVIRKLRSLLKKGPPQMGRIEPRELIGDVIALARSEGDRQGVSLRAEVSGDLPAIRGDRVQLQQVMLNLVMNGIEALKTIDDNPREVMILPERRGMEKVVVAVRDSGIGIDR